MKKEFEKAEVEVIEFEKEDVIATSQVITGPISADPVIDGGDIG